MNRWYRISERSTEAVLLPSEVSCGNNESRYRDAAQDDYLNRILPQVSAEPEPLQQFNYMSKGKNL